MKKPVERTIIYNNRQQFIRAIIRFIKLLDHECYVHDIRTFSCQRSARLLTGYVVYRWIISALCLTIFITTLFDLAKPPGPKRDATFYVKYFIYMTNLMLTLLAVQTTMGAILVTKAVCFYENRNPRFTDIKAKGVNYVYWKLHGLSVDAASVISLGYWLIVDRHRTYPLDGNNILAHAVSTIIAIADWLVTGLPHNFSDAWMGWLCMFCYFLFTIVYWVAGGKPRPSPLETEPKSRAIYQMCTNYVDAKPLLCMMAISTMFCTCHVLFSVVYYVFSWFRPKNHAVSKRHP